MPYEKLKSENYQNFGGRNRKASLYLTDATDVLDLVNYDFSTVGSLTRRAGTAVYPPGGASYGLTAMIGGLYEFSRLSGASFLVAALGPTLGIVNAGAPNGISAFYGVSTTVTSNNIFTFQTFVDRMFVSNGAYFIKWDGSTAYNFSLPPGTSLSVGQINGTTSVLIDDTLALGTYSYYYGYLNERGYAGPAIFGATITVVANPSGATLGKAVAISGFTTPNGYGITALMIYRTDVNLSVPALIGYKDPTFVGTTFIDAGLTFISSQIAPQYLWFTLLPQSMEIYNNSLFMAGFSSSTQNFFPAQTTSFVSRTYFSDVGQPEGVGTTNWIEYRTNDGDYVSCLKSYYGQLVVGKTKSVFALQGTSPPYLVNQISDQYGILSPRAAVVYNQIMWFLDEKGVCQYDGANISIVSNKVEDLFQRMNVAAARQVAMMTHIKERNEVWCSIPVDGATYNNMTVVYDYLANGWGEFEGFNSQSIVNGYGVFPRRTPIIGDNFGFLSYMGTTIMTDAYVAQSATLGASLGVKSITTMVQFRFEATPFGNATTKQFRRTWVDIAPVLGVTYAMQANFYADKGLSTVVYSATFAQGIFQVRNEIGIPAKSLSMQLINSDQLGLQLNGYVYAFRFQRDV